MKKKVFGILITGLLIVTVFPGVNATFNEINTKDISISTSNRLNDEILDQSTPLGSCVINNVHLAQSFKPKLPILSKVELGLLKENNITGNFTISIRDRLNGEDLVSKIISSEEVSWYGGWVTVDFDDITVTPNKRYYIMFHSDSDRNIYWFIANNNPYRRGSPWSLGGEGYFPYWLPLLIITNKNPDESFRSYGYQ